MALLTKQEFATQCKIKTKDLSVYIGRKQVIVKGDLIDTGNEINRSFLQKKGVSIAEAPAPPVVKKAKPAKVPAATDDDEQEIEIDDDEIPSYTESERKLKYLDTLKRNREVKLLEIKEQKQRGEVVPSDLVKPVFLQHNQSIVTEFKNMMEEQLRILAKKHDIKPNEVAEIKGKWVTSLNAAIKKATAATVQSVDTIIDEFAEKRGVGERS